MIDKEKKHNDRVDCERGNGNIQRVVAESLFFFGSLVFNERFVVRTKNFGKQIHAGLRENDLDETKPKQIEVKRLTEIIGNARAENIRQRGEEEMERAGKADNVFQCFDTFGQHKFTICDFKRITKEKESEILQGFGFFFGMVLLAFANSYPISFHGYDRAIRKRLTITFQCFKAKCALFLGRQIDESHDA